MTKEEFIKKWDTDSDYANGSKEMKKDLALLEQRLLSSEAEKGEAYPDTEADGIVFCGKCGQPNGK